MKKSSDKPRLLTYNRDYWYAADFETLTPNTDTFRATQEFQFIRREKYTQEQEQEMTRAQNTGTTQVILWCTQKYGNFEDSTIRGTDFDSFLKHLKSTGKGSTVWFHYLKFDGNFIVKQLIKKYTLYRGDELKHNAGFCFFKTGNKIYDIIYQYWNKKGKPIKIIFRCSLLLIPASIASIGESFGVAKLTDEQKENMFYDYEPEEMVKALEIYDKTGVEHEYLKYIDRDVNILNRALSKLEDTMNNIPIIIEKYKPTWRKNSKDEWVRKYNYLAPLKNLTIGGLAFNMMRDIFTQRFQATNLRKYKGVDFLNLHSQEDFEFFHKFYVGGWTQFNPVYQNRDYTKSIYTMIDINSSYPAQMTKPLPYGEKIDEKPIGDYVEWYEVHIKSAKIKKGFENCLILKNWKPEKSIDNHRYVKELKDFVCYYSKEEFEIIEKFYDIKIKCIYVNYQKAAPFFKEFVETFYEYKKQAKLSGDSAAELMFKILLNASYGKLAQRLEFEEMLYSLNSYEKGDRITQMVNDKEKYYDVLRESDVYKIDDKHKVYFLHHDKEIKDFKNVAAASYITSMGRVQLWTTILDVGVEKFVYTDTDSIVFKDIKDGDVKLGNELGEWKIERVGSYFETFGAKRYSLLDDNMEVIKSAFAGASKKFPKFKRDIDYNSYEDEGSFWIDGAKKQASDIKGGIILVDKGMTFRKGGT